MGIANVGASGAVAALLGAALAAMPRASLTFFADPRAVLVLLAVGAQVLIAVLDLGQPVAGEGGQIAYWVPLAGLAAGFTPPPGCSAARGGDPPHHGQQQRARREPAAEHRRAVVQPGDRGAAAGDHRLDAAAGDRGRVLEEELGQRRSCSAAPAFSPNSVWVKPGHSDVTETPVPPSSACTASENDWTKALLAA